MDEFDDTFRYVYSSSLEENVQIKVGTLEGENQHPPFEKLLDNPILRFSGLYAEKCPSFQVRLEVYNNGKPYCLPVATSYKAFTKRWSWNEWVTLPLEFCDLPRSAVLHLTVLDCKGAGEVTLIGVANISIFDESGMFRHGMFDLKLCLDFENESGSIFGQYKQPYQMEKLSKLTKCHRNGQMIKVDWLDRLTFREIEEINEREKKSSEYLYLMIEFPTVIIAEKNYHIVFYETEGDKSYKIVSKSKIVTVPDSEILQESLVERKHHRLARSARSGLSDRDAKPTASIRDQLHTIVYRYPPTYSLNSEEQDLMWKYRFYLSSHKKALAKFLKCINWQTGSEVRQALSLLAQWTPMNVEDSLELLSPSFTHPEVRKYAISRLTQAADEDLLLYLLQLVQALKYENFDDIVKSYQQLWPEDDVTSANDTFDQSTLSSSSNSSAIKRSVAPKCTGSVNSDVVNSETISCMSDSSHNVMGVGSAVPTDLATFLIQRASLNSTLANYLYWYLSIEVEEQETIRKQDERIRNMYVMVFKMFLKVLDTYNTSSKIIRLNLEKQQRFIDELVKLVKIVAKETGNRNKKTEKFKSLLSDVDTFKLNFNNFEPIPFPLDPEVCICKIIPNKTALFKSALMPVKLSFITSSPEESNEYVAIFKHGDDLRQDQLILQMITLMDKLLQKENLDLKLTPYKVLATSSKHGFLQYVESYTVADVLAREGSIHNFFRKYYPCETAPYGISPEIMDTYIKSCAGYCVITYLLGVGDRHLDNLLLTPSGKLFHIDFGYILGRDPKPMPPPMKLSKEMVEAMGGISSEHHHEFRKQCYTAYLHLRRHANVMLNLFSLMVDASIPDIALEPDKAVKKVEENLQLGLSDEEAVQHLQGLLDISITAVMPALVEQIHKIAQYWRK